jgi:hypothetical protein
VFCEPNAAALFRQCSSVDMPMLQRWMPRAGKAFVLKWGCLGLARAFFSVLWRGK